MSKSVRFLTQAAIIAAAYAALTLVLAPISFGVVQFRLSEALCVLPYFTPAAIPGLLVGCLISNSLGSSVGLIDVLLGSAATLIAAVASRFMPKYLVPLPPIISNGLIIGTMLHTVNNLPFWPTVCTIMVEEAVVCYAAGIPLMLLLDKYKDKLFRI